MQLDGYSNQQSGFLRCIRYRLITEACLLFIFFLKVLAGFAHILVWGVLDLFLKSEFFLEVGKE